MLSINSLNQHYGESHILRDANIEIATGCCSCLVGRNGVGKTTLLKATMGLLPARSGTIKLNGEDIQPSAAHDCAGLGIGYVPQGRELFPLLTVEENLKIGLHGSPIPERIFDVFPVLTATLARRGGDLSGG